MHGVWSFPHVPSSLSAYYYYCYYYHHHHHHHHPYYYYYHYYYFGLPSTMLEVLQHAQVQAEPTVYPSTALADTITGMGMTLAVMVGR